MQLFRACLDFILEFIRDLLKHLFQGADCMSRSKVIMNETLGADELEVGLAIQFGLLEMKSAHSELLCSLLLLFMVLVVDLHTFLEIVVTPKVIN